MTWQGCEIGRGVLRFLSLALHFLAVRQSGSIATCPLPESRGIVVTGRRYYPAHSEILVLDCTSE